MNRTDVSVKDYPLGEKKRDILSTPGGINIDEITFDNIRSGKVLGEDCRISRESLLMQAKIARDSGNGHIAANFERAAEMVSIESDRIIEIYNALRPYRSTQAELEEIARELREKYSAPKTADFVDSAAEVMKRRKKLKGDR